MEHYTVGCGERDFQELGIECADCWGLWDINRPLEGDCKVELSTDRRRDTFWYSSAHILNQVC